MDGKKLLLPSKIAVKLDHCLKFLDLPLGSVEEVTVNHEEFGFLAVNCNVTIVTTYIQLNYTCIHTLSILLYIVIL